MLCFYELHEVAALLEIGIQSAVAVNFSRCNLWPYHFIQMAAITCGHLADQLLLHLPD